MSLTIVEKNHEELTELTILSYMYGYDVYWDRSHNDWSVVSIYTKRPDGSYYHLVATYPQKNQLYELIESGIEPYRAFEIVAL